MFIPSHAAGKFAKWALCAALLIGGIHSASVPANAQGAGATLSGSVSDPSSGVIPNATVAIKNSGTGDVRQTTSNAGGFYSAPSLQPGNYDVTVTAKGFRGASSAITLNVGAQQELNFNLKVGDVSQSVEVQATPPEVQTASSTISATVDSSTVRELPLNGRDWTSLATLQPGVISIPNQATTSFSANKGNRGFGNQLTNSGHRPNENSYRVDGISVNDYTNAAPGGATGVNLGVDGIQEFSVLTTGYTAEYGRTSGAVINAITRGGTNAFHGTAFGFLRNDALDARNFFDKATAPPFKRSQYGGSAGTRIIKDRTFVFGAYEGIHQTSSSSGTIRVPDAALRALAVPAVRPYLALWPVAPAGTPDPASGVQTFGVSLPNSAHENYFTTRVDHKISDKDNLAFSYYHDAGPQQQTDPLGNAVHQVVSSRQLVSAQETHIVSSAFLNTFRAGFNRTIGDINTPVSGTAAATDKSLAIAPIGLATPQIAVSGLTTAVGLGGLNQFIHTGNSFQFYDDAYLTRGTHAIKLGFAFERIQYNIIESLSPNGSLSSYKTLAAFLSNTANKLSARPVGQGHEVGIRESLFAGYVQDDWRLRSNLTLNLGLRYEFTTLPTNATTLPAVTGNGFSIASAPIQEITTLSGCNASPTACGPVGVNTFIAANPTKNNWEPRIGFAYDPFKNGKTSIRGGFAMFDVLPLPYLFALNTSATSPFQIIGSDTQAVLGVIDNKVSFDPQKVRNRYVEQNPKRADVLNWNLNVQRQLATGLTLQVGYIGSRSIHLSSVADDINLVQPTLVSGVGYVFPLNGTRVNPNWGGSAGIRPLIFDTSAHYNAIQSQLKKTLSHGVQAQGSYTYGKCFDTGSSPIAGDTYLNSIATPLLLVRAARAGPCDYDIHQVFVGNFIWQVPSIMKSSKLVSAATSGWELGSIVTRATGAPFTVTVGGGGDPLNNGYNGDFSQDFANILPNCNPINGGFHYINTSCFTLPSAPNVLGNSTRNQFSGPGLVTWDMSLFRNIKVRQISDAFNIQFRAEAFNLLNHTNFLSPGFLNTFGQNNSVLSGLSTDLNQTSTSSRQIQFGLKLAW